MKILMTNGIQFLLIQYTLIPKPISFCVKLCLEMTSQHILNFACKIFTLVEREHLQQVHLGRI